MKKNFLALLLCLACAAGVLTMSAAAAPAPCRAETAETTTAAETGIQTVTVTGNGRITVKADSAILNFGIRTSSNDLTAGTQKNAETAKRVIETLKSLGYDESCVTTEQFSAYPVCREGEGESYEICRNFQVKVKADANCDSLVSSLTEAGANTFHGMRYTLEAQSAAYRDALKAAKADALEKAAVLQENLELVELIECGTYWYCDNSLCHGADCIVVEANVQAVFAAR